MLPFAYKYTKEFKLLFITILFNQYGIFSEGLTLINASLPLYYSPLLRKLISLILKLFYTVNKSLIFSGNYKNYYTYPFLNKFILFIYSRFV